MRTALVLAGGGVTGIAWETGVLLGLDRSGALPRPDLVIGTSAGAAVGAALLSAAPLDELYARQVAVEHQEIAPELDLDQLMVMLAEVGDLSAGLTPAQRRRVGQLARSATTVEPARRREVIASRLPSHDWPQTPLRLTTVDTATGERVVLDQASGVPLVEAVMASCAVPGVWPIVPVLGRELMDGGVCSPANLDLAAGYDEILVLVPLVQGNVLATVEREAAALRDGGARVTLVVADPQATDAMGVNPLDPERRPVAAEHGLRQGLASR